MKNPGLKLVLATVLCSLTVSNTGCSFLQTIMQMLSGPAGQAVTKQTGSSELGGVTKSAMNSYSSSSASKTPPASQRTATSGSNKTSTADAGKTDAPSKPAAPAKQEAKSEVTRIKAGDEP
ncbi:MAG: hypothetical protein HYY25_15245 [Candidatus Wallbacteria bacterium]|nr:hypothetical protein [Candidatus Wallbacteria bacterium]MBI4868210.1 hypothetical protein [Candidatus Wallbacteria bacterium]